MMSVEQAREYDRRARSRGRALRQPKHDDVMRAIAPGGAQFPPTPSLAACRGGRAWASDMQRLDLFSGGTVVHINAGVAGLVACLVLGKRHGYGKVAHAPHNLTLSIIGASLLWVGWFGFNAGSAVTAGPNAAMAMVVTQIATAAAALAWMFAEWLSRGKPSVLGIVSGAVAGLVAITPAAGFVDPMGALIIGLIAGVVCFVASTSVKNALGYDDSLDVWGVHGVGGIVGAILTGVFADPAINALGKDATVLKQLYGIVFTIIWTAVASFVILYVVKALVGLRPSKQEEIEGLDVTLHGEVVQ